MTFPRFFSVLALALLAAQIAFGACRSRTDAAGDPLPPGAIAQLGVLRQQTYYTYDVRFTPDGKTIQTVSASRTLFCEWDAATGALRRSRPVVQKVPGIAKFTPDISSYAIPVGNNRLRMVRTATGKTVWERAMSAGVGASLEAFSSDGKRFALTGARCPPGSESWENGHLVAVWSVGAAAPRLLQGLPGQINHVRFSPDGNFAATAHPLGTVLEWDLKQRRR
jgi:WD40 repeat protein